jgi:hypothetical protein
MSDKPAEVPEKPKKTEPDKTKREKAREIANQSIKMAVNSEQNFLLHFLPEILTSVQKDRDVIDDADKVFYLDENKTQTYEKRFLNFETKQNAQGALQKLLSYLTRGEKISVFEKVPNSILSSFLPDIKIFKVYKGKKGKIFNWQIPFNSHIDSKDIQNILNSGRGMLNNAILKSFTYEFRGTDFVSAEKNIKATLQIGFDSIDKLTETIPVVVPESLRTYFFDSTDAQGLASGAGKSFRFSDLVMNNDEVFTKKPHPDFYTIKVLLGIKLPEPKILDELSDILKEFGVDKETLKDAITESKMVLSLYHTGHDLQFNEDGSIDFTLEYVGANETSVFDPIYDVLLVSGDKQRLVDLIKDAGKLSEQQTAIEACFNQSKTLLDVKTQGEQKAANDAFKLKQQAFKKKIELNRLEIESARSNVKAGFLTAVQEEVPIYEIKVEPKFKSLFKSLADSKNPAGIKELTEEVFEKTTLRASDIQRIKGQDPTLAKLVELYKKLQKANAALVDLKKSNEIANGASARELAELNKKLYPEEPSITFGDWAANVFGTDTRSEGRKQIIEKIRKDPRFKYMYVPPMFDEADIAGLFARSFNPSILESISAERAAIEAREKAYKAKEKEAQGLQDKIQNDLTAVVDFAGQKTRFVLLGDILNLGLKCLSNGTSDDIEFLIGFSAMSYTQMADSRRKTLEEDGLNKAGFINSYNFADGEKKFIEILFGMEKFPISMNRLNLFFVDKVAKRNTDVYPLPLFVTDLIELAEKCTVQSLAEQTKSIVKLDMQKSFLFVPTVDLNKCKKDGYNNVLDAQKGLPKSDPSNMVKNNKSFVNLCYYYSRGFVPTFKQRLIPDSGQNIPERYDPRANSIYNISLGSKTGILKKISYTRNKQPYYTEAKMKASGELADGKAAYALRVKYDASITTYGTSLFRPGDYVYLNPVTISSKENATQLVLDQLGIGGFYFVNKSTTTISDSNFETVVDAKFHSYSNGEPIPLLTPTDEVKSKCADTLKDIIKL